LIAVKFSAARFSYMGWDASIQRTGVLDMTRIRARLLGAGFLLAGAVAVSGCSQFLTKEDRALLEDAKASAAAADASAKDAAAAASRAEDAADEAEDSAKKSETVLNRALRK
jgi:hypothetical protein